MASQLTGKVALVAGATRGAGRGIAVALGAAGATVYVTGRSVQGQRSEMNRPETIEQTATLVDQAGGRGVPVQVDHLVPDQVRSLVGRIDSEQGALHILVNNIWGATKMEWNKTVWECDLAYGLRMLELGVHTHAITSHFAIPLLIKRPGGLVVEVTDGTDTLQFRQLSRVFLLRSREVGREPHGLRSCARVEASRCDRRFADAGLAQVGGHA